MTEQVTYDAVASAADRILSAICHRPTVGIVLGSGWGSLAERVRDPKILAYGEIPHFPRSTVVGHCGRIVSGKLGGVQALLMQGRVHFYEGYSAAQITLPIRVIQALGATTLIVTNAAGGLAPDMRPGDIMAITDHVNLMGLTGHHPLRGPNDERFGARFPDMSCAYDRELLALLKAEAEAQGVALCEGIYIMVAGPSFETPAEVRFLRSMGDAVGMSTAPEVIAARHGGLRVLGISVISNVAIDSTEAIATHPSDTPSGLNAAHEDVLDAVQRTIPRVAPLIEGVLRRLA